MNNDNQERINQFVINALECYANKEKKSTFPLLYGRFCKEIIDFLNDKENKILFINIPVEELSPNQEMLDDCWSKFCDFISLVLRLSLKREVLEPVKLGYRTGNPEDESWYQENSSFLLLSDNNGCYFLSGESQDNDYGKKLVFRTPGNRNFRGTNDSKRNLIQNARCIYHLLNVPEQLLAGYNEIKKELLKLDMQCIEVDNQEFVTASLVCSPFPKSLVSAGKYVCPVVEVLNAKGNPKADIVTILGDKSFDMVQRMVNRLAPNGYIKKLIVIGSRPPQYLLNQKHKEVVLSFKMIYDYCAPDVFKKKVGYSEPVLKEIEFPWLVNALTELCKILEATRESIGNNNMRYIRNYVRKVFSDINFTKTIFVDFKERQFPNIINNMELEDIVVERLEEWLDALSYESDSNPKQDYANSIKSENKKIVTPNRSIVRQVQGAWGYSVIMDAPVHSGDHTQADQITTVLRYHNFAKVEGLYYKDVESALMAYTKRKLLQDSLYENKIPSVSSNDISGFTLDDYMAVSEDMTAMLAQTYSRTQITFSDGTIVNIDGKVLQRSTDSEKWTLESLEDVEAPQGKEITYYLQDSSLFYRLFKIHLGLPNDGDIDTYSALWHDKLRDSLGDSEEKKLLFCEKVGISHLVLKNQLEGKSRFLRKTQKMLKALDILVSDGNISEEQKEYIMAARKCMNSESIAFGTKLKSALLNYRMNGTIDAELGRILDKAGMDIASLVEEFLFTKTIKSVNYGRYNG